MIILILLPLYPDYRIVAACVKARGNEYTKLKNIIPLVHGLLLLIDITQYRTYQSFLIGKKKIKLILELTTFSGK